MLKAGITRSRHARWFAAALLTLVFAYGAEANAQVLVVVYGEPITNLDIEQRARLDQLAGQRPMGRKELLEELINDKLKVREGKRFGITVSDSEVDDAFASMASRMRLKPEQLAEQMSRQGTNASVVKSRIRSDMVWNRLVRGRFSSTLTVGERDILQAIESKNVTEKDTTGYEYSVRPILFLVPEGSPQSAYDSRRREADAFRSRFQGCDAGVNMARALRDVAVREKIVRTSGDIPAQMRTTLDNLEIGRLTPPEQTKYGVEMFALCEKVATRADSPLKKEARDAVFSQKFDQQAKTYLERIRRSAMIEYK